VMTLAMGPAGWRQDSESLFAMTCLPTDWLSQLTPLVYDVESETASVWLLQRLQSEVVRLRVFYPFMGPGRNRPAWRDDTAQFCAQPSSCPKERHVFRSPRWHRLNRWDNNDTLPETVVKSRVDTRERSARELFPFTCPRLYEAGLQLFRFESSAPESLPHRPKGMPESRYRAHRPQAEAWPERAPAIAAAGDFAPRWNDHAYSQSQQPVHAKAGSRWPEHRDARCAVASLLFSRAQDLVPAWFACSAGSRTS